MTQAQPKARGKKRPPPNRKEQAGTQAIHGLLLAWYDRHARVLPWRAPPGERAEPYRVWLSEIMLQQTTVAAVQPYFARFLERWPRIEDLAAAPQEEVLAAWAGLGYYARARNLHRCAQVVAAEHGGRFPGEEEELLKLPGIGPYTAAALASIAFGRPAAPVDGNWERVLARLFAVGEAFPEAKPRIREIADRLVHDARPGDFAQAVMDLGATICLPRTPKCLLCPLQDLCRARAQGLEKELPRAAPKKAKPTRRGVAFWITDGAGRVLLRRRPPKGLLGGMMEVPSTPWREEDWQAGEAAGQAPLEAVWKVLPGQVSHTFTHFHLELEVWAAEAPKGPGEGEWAELARIGEAGLPSVMMKVVRHAAKAAGAS